MDTAARKRVSEDHRSIFDGDLARPTAFIRECGLSDARQTVLPTSGIGAIGCSGG